MINLTGQKDENRKVYIARVKQWTKETLHLSETSSLMVTEIACTEPDCPTVGTLIAVWDNEGKRHEYKINAPLRAVQQPDVEKIKPST